MAAERSDVQYSLLACFHYYSRLLISSHFYDIIFSFCVSSKRLRLLRLSLLCKLSKTNSIKHVAIVFKYIFHLRSQAEIKKNVKKILLQIYVLKHLDMNLCISSWNSAFSIFICVQNMLHKSIFLLPSSCTN